jgi:hypothetical protein
MDFKQDPAAGPVQNMFQTFCSGWDAAGFGFEPMMKAAARSNIEAVTLASQRAQAYLELPSRLGQCRTPQDLAGEQMRFWQTMAQQYTECSRRIMTTWTSCAHEVGNRAKSESQRERDYITFPEPQQEREAERGTRTPGERRAA